jgi:hypothetical protein
MVIETLEKIGFKGVRSSKVSRLIVFDQWDNADELFREMYSHMGGTMYGRHSPEDQRKYDEMIDTQVVNNYRNYEKVYKKPVCGSGFFYCGYK